MCWISMWIWNSVNYSNCIHFMDNLQILQIAYVGAIVYIVQTLCQNILLTLLTGRQFKTNKNQIGSQTNDYFICDLRKNKQSLVLFNILPYVEQCVVLCHIYLTLPISISEKNNFKKIICVRREFSLIISKNVVKQWSMGRYYTRKCFFFFLWWYEITILLLKEIDLCLNCLSISLDYYYASSEFLFFSSQKLSKLL